MLNFSAAADTLDHVLSKQSMSYSFERQRSFSYPTGILCSDSEFPWLLINNTGILQEKCGEVFKQKTKDKIVLWNQTELILSTHLVERLFLLGAGCIVPLPSVNH